jgi:hypothetical protein
MNGDTGANYAGHHLTGDGATSGARFDGVSASSLSASWGGLPGTNSSTAWGAWIIDFLDYADTNKHKTMRSLAGYDGNGAGEISFNSGVWMSTSAINQIVLYGQNFAINSHFALYGLRG